jgi:hypothetical protein
MARALLSLQSMDALELLRTQHAEIRGLFARTETLDAGDRSCALDILVEAIDLHLERSIYTCASRQSARLEWVSRVPELRKIARVSNAYVTN